MESLKNLNKICQKPNYKTSGNWMVRTFLRDAALPCTWLLLHTPVTANQVTSAALAIGLAACLCISIPTAGAFLAGAMLLQFWYYLDHVDGLIARYRKTAGTTGRFYDFLMHHVIHTLLVFSLGISFSRGIHWGECGIYVSAAIAFLMSIFNFMHDIKSKAFVERLLVEDYIKRLRPESVMSGERPVLKSTGIAKRFFSFLHKSCEIHVMMNLLTLFAFIQILLRPGFDFRVTLYSFYAVAIVLISFIKIYYFIVYRKADEEFSQLFEQVSSNGPPSAHS